MEGRLTLKRERGSSDVRLTRRREIYLRTVNVAFKSVDSLNMMSFIFFFCFSSSPFLLLLYLLLCFFCLFRTSPLVLNLTLLSILFEALSLSRPTPV